MLRVLVSVAARNDTRLEGRPRAARRPAPAIAGRRSAPGSRIPNTGPGPLAARVIVNRLWQHHFGQGIVATPNDFGSQGSRPSHPELLDWLANALVEQRLAAQADPSTDRHQRRLHAGQPSTTKPRAGRSRERVPVATAPRGDWRPSRSATRCWRRPGGSTRRMYGPGSLDVEMPRRSVYFFIKRSRLIPMMMLFDWPEHLVSIGQRSTTTTAPQALAMLNSGLARHCAEGFAARVAAGGDRGYAVARPIEIAFGRDPTESETRLAASFLAAPASGLRPRRPARSRSPAPRRLLPGDDRHERVYLYSLNENARGPS